MSSDPTILFNVGATKAGTSWLYSYLSAHPDCHLRSVKELHYFDAIDRDDRDWQTGRFRKRIARLETAGDATPERAEDYEALISLLEAEQENTAGYISYLTQGRGAQKLVADITPSYALLSADRFAAMAGIAADVRFIYILRDPVARLWSHIRMKAGRRALSGGTVQEHANQIFWRIQRGRKFKGIHLRGDYKTVLEKLLSAVNPKKLLVLFFEDLFSPETVSRICGFLGISDKAANLDALVNQSPPAEMSDQQRVLAYEWLAEQYDYVREKFGPLPAAWQTNMTKVSA